ncbi:NitT/TauT family transport system substrate-binding protein [Gemmobacter megaterium]|uniref:NitT/TauT family transport system substrate-binding protein n=1 Tax=Gemmobacter megaterium TaxID=1086013 RepID=A0A1N7M693_9RHOB|nr:ABC transporter substrate-binding protein [Gemmobacter megaterium]GGE08653.1 ABC transporter substrate-binding protein [Gemmobacter megaterium]SIS81604.1 NitT/TauT family transport system substrate-binding protein [Gemmobacter megaterium]
MFHRALTAAATSLLLASTAMAETAINFALDWKFEGPAAPYFAAIDNGHFAAEGLKVEIQAGQGSLDAIPKVATGAFPMGFADMNSIAKFLDQNPGAPVTAVMMVYDKPPAAMVGRKSLGISEIKDIEGKVLGAPPPDGAWSQFPVFAKETGLDMSKVTVEPLGFPTREPMLAEGKVAAVTGFSFSVVLNLTRLGVAEDDISVFTMADHGVDYYGNAVIVNTDFAKANPEAVTGFIRALAKGWKDAATEPEKAVGQMISRTPASDVALETRRLQMALEGTVLTDWVKANGMGNVDPARYARSIEQLKEIYEFKNAPTPDLYFTDAYLPTDGSLTFE